jgi:hypothetical protein
MLPVLATLLMCRFNIDPFVNANKTLVPETRKNFDFIDFSFVSVHNYCST